MDSHEDGRLERIAMAISDGMAVDWSAEESAARDPHDADAIARLKTVEAIAQLHRSVSDAEASAPGNRPSPTSWGHLTLLERVGAGAFGEVYRAWDTRLDREVALKLLHRRDVADGSSRTSGIVDEGRLLARVRHPNVVTVYGAERIDGSVGLWMDFIRGRTLAQVLREHGPFSAREAASMGLDICRALSAVHRAGLLHRDIKPQNVMREEGGRIVLMDFGTGRELADDERDGLRDLAGTPLYLAPEVFAGKPATARSDIYGLGVLLYHLVTGSYPVSGGSVRELREKHANGARQWLRDARPDLPQEFVAVVERATAPDPAARFDSAGAMESALSAAVSGADAAPARPAPNRARPLVVYATAAVVVFAIAGVASFNPFGLRDRWLPSRGPSSIRSLAVLPLVNLSGPEDEFFSDGMTDILTAELSKVGAFSVISRTSAMQYKSVRKPMSDIARDLNVDGVIEGSVLRSGGRLRITAQLIQASSDTHLWADSYDRNVSDAFALQREVALDIAKALKVSITTREAPRVMPQRPTDGRAQEVYLKGWEQLERFNLEGTRNAVRYLEEAVRLDPNYALAYAELAHSYWSLQASYGELTAEEGYRKSRAAALRAIELDSTLPRAHWALANTQFYYDWDWNGAEASFRRAIELNPSDADAHQQFAWYLAARGQLDAAIIEVNRARELDPLSYSRRVPVATILYYGRKYDQAIAEFRSALKVESQFVIAHFGLGRVYAAKRMYRESLAELEGPGSGPELFRQAEIARTYAESGDRQRAQALLEALLASSGSEPPNPGMFAFIYAALGERDRAFALLDQAVAEHSSGLVWLGVDPRFDSLRSDPRFRALLTRIGLQP